MHWFLCPWCKMYRFAWSDADDYPSVVLSQRIATHFIGIHVLLFPCLFLSCSYYEKISYVSHSPFVCKFPSHSVLIGSLLDKLRGCLGLSIRNGRGPVLIPLLSVFPSLVVLSPRVFFRVLLMKVYCCTVFSPFSCCLRVMDDSLVMMSVL